LTRWKRGIKVHWRHDEGDREGGKRGAADSRASTREGREKGVITEKEVKLLLTSLSEGRHRKGDRDGRLGPSGKKINMHSTDRTDRKRITQKRCRHSLLIGRSREFNREQQATRVVTDLLAGKRSLKALPKLVVDRNQEKAADDRYEP